MKIKLLAIHTMKQEGSFHILRIAPIIDERVAAAIIKLFLFMDLWMFI